jgi:hypothetical protein
LLRGQFGKLQCHRSESDEAVRMRRAHLRQLLILQIDQLAREILVRGIPESVDAHGLDVDPHFVHRLNPRGSQAGVIVSAERDSGARAPLDLRALEQLRGFGHAHVAVDVHGFHAALPYHGGLVFYPASNLRGPSRGHRIAEFAADKNDASGGAHNALYKIPAIRHRFSFSCRQSFGTVLSAFLCVLCVKPSKKLTPSTQRKTEDRGVRKHGGNPGRKSIGTPTPCR